MLVLCLKKERNYVLFFLFLLFTNVFLLYTLHQFPQTHSELQSPWQAALRALPEGPVLGWPGIEPQPLVPKTAVYPTNPAFHYTSELRVRNPDVGVVISFRPIRLEFRLGGRTSEFRVLYQER